MARRPPKETAPPEKRSQRRWVWPAAAVVVVVLLGISLARLPVLSPLATVTLVLALLFALSGIFLALWRRLLWRVGRRLAFSYFLIGVLPIPLLAILLGVGVYLLSGFFLSHLFRSSLELVYSELVTTAAVTQEAVARGARGSASPLDELEVVLYRNGRRITDSQTAPASWPAWLAEETRYAVDSESRGILPPLVRSGTGEITIAAAVGDETRGTLVLYRGELADGLRERSRIWVELVPAGEQRETVATLQVFGSEWTLMPLRRADASTSLEEFYVEGGTPPRWFVVGLEAAGPLYELADGDTLSPAVSATVFAPPSTVSANLLSRSSEVDTIAWVAFLVPTFLLFDIYLVALVMAAYLIFGLSRAVNQLSRATASVQQSDFSQRIKVRRLDQVGDLQRSFNDMTAHLETLVHRAAEQEVIAKELEIAQELQKGLLPKVVDAGGALDVACYFEPSTVIGGDYYDLLRLPEERHRMAIVNADVSGHGLPAGLRMAMIKSALDILVRERKELEDILVALDTTVRMSGDRRSFVTAVVCMLDLELGTVDIANAGHPPTYLLRNEGVTEICMEGSPLGTLSRDYQRRSLRLERGDVLTWLSDGLIEATNDDDAPFGYDGILRALEGPSKSARQVRDRVIEAVRLHCAGRPADDDRTMVVVRYLGPPTEESRPIDIA